MSVAITKPSDLLQYADQIKHDFFDEGMSLGLKTTVTFFVEGGPSVNSVIKMSKPVDDFVHQMNQNLNLALDSAVDHIRANGLSHTYLNDGEVVGEVDLVLGGELAEQDE